jgi:hypothetical protein
MNIDKQLLIDTLLYLQTRPFVEVSGLMAKYLPIIQELNNAKSPAGEIAEKPTKEPQNVAI